MIESFTGKFKFLSNFHYIDSPIKVRPNLTFATVEHWYVANKSKELKWQMEVSRHPLKGLKSLGRSVALRDDWEEVKIPVMAYGLSHKFNKNKNLRLYNLLQETKGLHIQEGNWWNDKFWGVCLKTGEGKNILGSLLMEVRDFPDFNYKNYLKEGLSNENI